MMNIIKFRLVNDKYRLGYHCNIGCGMMNIIKFRLVNDKYRLGYHCNTGWRMINIINKYRLDYH
jgi:ribosomal protein S4E